MDEILEISNLTFEENGKKEFENLDLCLNYNNWYTLISEKSNPSTLVRILAGLIENYEGKIEFNFLELNQENIHEIRTRLSILFPNIDDQILTADVYDEITFELNNMHYESDLKDQLITEMDEYTKIKDLLDKKISDLTEEEKYVVLLTSALIIKPKMLIIDETFSTLAKNLRKRLYNIINFYRKDNKLTVLNITNNLDDSLLGDNTIYLKEGKVLFNEKTEKVYEEKLLTEEIESLPFIVKLSEYLKLYNLTAKNYYSLEEVVAAIWK